jgi:mono/diheme cytochrome c family protein
MLRIGWIELFALSAIALAALLLIRLHSASGATLEDSVAAGRRLTEIWCSKCHLVTTGDTRVPERPPDFTRIANVSTTESIKAFLRKDHARMPNFLISTGQSEDIAQFIMSLKRN